MSRLALRLPQRYFTLCLRSEIYPRGIEQDGKRFLIITCSTQTPAFTITYRRVLGAPSRRWTMCRRDDYLPTFSIVSTNDAKSIGEKNASAH